MAETRKLRFVLLVKIFFMFIVGICKCFFYRVKTYMEQLKTKIAITVFLVQV